MGQSSSYRFLFKMSHHSWSILRIWNALLIKDLKGDVEVLVLYNYETKSVHKDSKFIWPIDIQLIIKEPYMQLFGLEEDETDFGIRVDSPTDVVVQSYSDCDSASN